MILSLFLVALLGAEQASVPPGTELDKSVEFLGFSANETVHAWRVSVVARHPSGYVDRFSIVRLVDSETDVVLATFRDSNIRTTDFAGRRLATGETATRRANPD